MVGVETEGGLVLMFLAKAVIAVYGGSCLCVPLTHLQDARQLNLAASGGFTQRLASREKRVDVDAIFELWILPFDDLLTVFLVHREDFTLARILARPLARKGFLRSLDAGTRSA